MSYAQQAQFDLTGARASLQQAVEVNPNDALAWARLAELHMSFGDLDDALEAAQKAAAIDPNLSRTQTVLGFAYLTQVKTTESKKAFERAIELDQGDPLARLGLGLALIREGDLEAGRGELDIAVSLDPDNSLMRSYLGKAYYEEKLDKQSADSIKWQNPWIPRIRHPIFTTLSASRPPTGRWKRCKTCKKPLSSTITERSIARVSNSIPTWLHAARARREFTAISASSSWRWSKDGSRSTPIRRISPPIVFWLIVFDLAAPRDR